MISNPCKIELSITTQKIKTNIKMNQIRKKKSTEFPKKNQEIKKDVHKNLEIEELK